MLVRSGLTIAFLLSSVFLQAQAFNNHRGADSNNSSMIDLTVTVYTAMGQPAPDARVELRGTGVANDSFTGYTNNLGVAQLTHIPNGSYTLDVTYKLAQVQQRASLAFGEHNFTVTLPADATGADRGSSSSVSVAAYKVPDKAVKEYKKAEEALANGKRDEADSHLSKALNIYADYADALTLRGILKMDRQDQNGALADFDAAIKSDSSCSLAYFAIGAAFNSLQRYDEAVRSLERGLTLDPRSWQGYFEMGKALVGKGEYQAGIEQMQKAESIVNVKYPPIHLVKAHAMLALKQYPGAMKELQAFISEAPNDKRVADAQQTLDKVNAFVAKDSVASVK